MSGQNDPHRNTSGSKAIAIDGKRIMMRYRLYIFLSIVSSAALALSLHLIFSR